VSFFAKVWQRACSLPTWHVNRLNSQPFEALIDALGKAYFVLRPSLSGEGGLEGLPDFLFHGLIMLLSAKAQTGLFWVFVGACLQAMVCGLQLG